METTCRVLQGQAVDNNFCIRYTATEQGNEICNEIWEGQPCRASKKRICPACTKQHSVDELHVLILMGENIFVFDRRNLCAHHAQHGPQAKRKYQEGFQSRFAEATSLYLEQKTAEVKQPQITLSPTEPIIQPAENLLSEGIVESVPPVPLPARSVFRVLNRLAKISQAEIMIAARPVVIQIIETAVPEATAELDQLKVISAVPVEAPETPIVETQPTEVPPSLLVACYLSMLQAVMNQPLDNFHKLTQPELAALLADESMWQAMQKELDLSVEKLGMLITRIKKID